MWVANGFIQPAPGFRGRAPGEILGQTTKNRGEEPHPGTPGQKALFASNKRKAPRRRWFRNAVLLSASKILPQVWEDENSNDLGRNKASLPWAARQAEVGGKVASGSVSGKRSANPILRRQNPTLRWRALPLPGKRAPSWGAPLRSLPLTLCSLELGMWISKSSSPNFVVWCPFPQPPLFRLPVGEGGDTTRPPAAVEGPRRSAKLQRTLFVTCKQ